MYAGGRKSTSNNTYYLYNGRDFFTISPSRFITYTTTVALGGSYAQQNYIYNDGYLNESSTNDSRDIRPVISTKSTDEVLSGDGTSTNPYVIRDKEMD
jgi:hypothetical protein